MGFEISHGFKFSPVYDSGSCLGREFDDKKIESLLNDEGAILRYIEKARSEIKWNHSELNLFEMVRNVNQLYPQLVKEKSIALCSPTIETEMEHLIDTIDVNAGDSYHGILLSTERKRLIDVLLKRRINYLKRILKDA